MTQETSFVFLKERLRRSPRWGDWMSVNHSLSHNELAEEPAAIAARLEQQGLVHRALVGLDDPYRTVLILHFQDGCQGSGNRTHSWFGKAVPPQLA